MSLWKFYTDYINDNPKGYWYRRKMYGWGWTPATWQGWVSLLVYVVGITVIFMRVDVDTLSTSDALINITIPIIALTAALIITCYLKGEPPRWQWGPDKDKK